MGRFFPFRRPQRGMPISLRGLARGLAKLDDALSGISIENGTVEWSASDVPHLVFGDDGRGSLPGKTEDGAGLPSGGSQYQVLQRDAAGAAVWDWVRVSVPEEE